MKVELTEYTPKPGSFVVVHLVDGALPTDELAQAISETVGVPVLVANEGIKNLVLVDDKVVPFLRFCASKCEPGDDAAARLEECAKLIESGEFLRLVP